MQPVLSATLATHTGTSTSNFSLPMHHHHPPPSSSPINLDTPSLTAIVASAIALNVTLKQQRAYYTFESLPRHALGRTEFEGVSMFTCQGVKSHEEGMAKMIQLILAPRLVRWGSEDGKDFNDKKQVVRMEVQTRPVALAADSCGKEEGGLRAKVEERDICDV